MDTASQRECRLSRAEVKKIAEELSSERKIGAIKALREATGWGLKESKDYIDQYFSPYKYEARNRYGLWIIVLISNE